jgi:hypothetical protein
MKNRTKTVIFSGGLGNQLFQFAFLHVLSREGNEAIDLYFPVQNDESRPFNLHRLVEGCTHIGNIRLIKSRRIDFLLKLADFLSHRFPNSKLDKFLFIPTRETNAYSFSELKVEHDIFSGYYQNWEYVNKVIDVIDIEVNLVLTNTSSSVTEALSNTDYGVLHFRRGDLLQFSDSMGVLEVDYFRKAVETAQLAAARNTRLLVISDDPVVATKEFSSTSSDIYGPEELSEWEALALMSKAKFVITSNSTFSWWGGLLATRNGGTAYIPDPWFLNWLPNPAKAFHFPGFKALPSVFENVPSEVDIDLS